jgi:hypothetical protein
VLYQEAEAVPMQARTAANSSAVRMGFISAILLPI